MRDPAGTWPLAILRRLPPKRRVGGDGPRTGERATRNPTLAGGLVLVGPERRPGHAADTPGVRPALKGGGSRPTVGRLQEDGHPRRTRLTESGATRRRRHGVPRVSVSLPLPEVVARGIIAGRRQRKRLDGPTEGWEQARPPWLTSSRWPTSGSAPRRSLRRSPPTHICRRIRYTSSPGGRGGGDRQAQAATGGSAHGGGSPVELPHPWVF